MSEPQYRYFSNGYYPIRATLSPDPAHNGTIIGTETPNRDTGQMELNMHFVNLALDKSGDIEEITEEDFNQKCTEFYAQKKSDLGMPVP